MIEVQTNENDNDNNLSLIKFESSKKSTGQKKNRYSIEHVFRFVQKC